jgi:hypothetical protein
MASSFISQVSNIVYLVSQIKPKSILDVGKGFGKYGFLLHEYVGINNSKRLNPAQTLKEQSDILIDAVEIDDQLLLPHLDQFYNKVYRGNILEMYSELINYDLIMLIDVIEHLEKKAAIKMLQFYSQKKINIIIATPSKFFNQHLYDSKYEEHVSFWELTDFKKISNVEYQKVDGGTIFFLTPERIDIRGFGNSVIKRIRRIFRVIRNEF